jgi:hypothetical protein
MAEHAATRFLELAVRVGIPRAPRISAVGYSDAEDAAGGDPHAMILMRWAVSAAAHMPDNTETRAAAAQLLTRTRSSDDWEQLVAADRDEGSKLWCVCAFADARVIVETISSRL